MRTDQIGVGTGRLRITISMKFAFCCLFSVLCTTLVGCASSRHVKTLSIVYIETPEYERRKAAFSVSLEDARAIVVKRTEEENRRRNPLASMRYPSALKWIPNHSIIVGSWYHFYEPRKDGQIPLAGTYVDGFTGELEVRNSSVRLKGRWGDYHGYGLGK